MVIGFDGNFSAVVEVVELDVAPAMGLPFSSLTTP